MSLARPAKRSQLQLSVKEHLRPVHSLAFSADGLLASAGADNRICLNKFDLNEKSDIVKREMGQMKCESGAEQLTFDKSSPNRLGALTLMLRSH